MVIPASFEVDGEEYSVTTIGSENGLNASFPNDKIASVVISEGITRIEACAFYRNKSIVSVSLPNTLTSIGMQAFYNCSVSTKINFPASLTDIDWVDHEGNYVGTGSILKPAEGAMEYLYTITLGEELLLKYHIPAQGSLVSSVNDVIQADIVFDAIDETTFYGVVVDKLGNPLSDAKIALTQTVNGRKVELEDPSNEGQYSSRVHISILVTQTPSPTPGVDKNPSTDVIKGQYYYNPAIMQMFLGLEIHVRESRL